MSDFDDFSIEYADRVDDLTRSSHRTFSLRLNDWLDLLDSSPVSREIVDRLTAGFDFSGWYAAAVASVGSMVGSGNLNLSRDRQERLAQYLGLVRHLASDENAYVDFSSKFVWAGSRLDDNVEKINAEIVAPFARDLLKHIDKEHGAVVIAPASDRIVTLNHNSADAAELGIRLAEIEQGMVESNSLRLDEEYDRNLAEVAAARRLLSASKVRVSALQQLLVPALRWLGTGTADTALTIAVTAVAVLLAKLFGIAIPGLG